MKEESQAVGFLRKSAKKLHASIVAGDRAARARATAVFRDLADRNDAEVSQGSTLMRAQHVVAVEHGFAKWDAVIGAPEIEVYLAITMGKLPNLTDFGIGLYQGDRKLTPEQREAKHVEMRAVLRGSSDRVARVVDWLKKNIQPIKTISKRRTSYGLKHFAEKDTGYITNGVFIAAAIIAGYPYEIQPESPNVCFGMSERSITALTKVRRTRSGPDRRYVSDAEQERALLAAGWSRTDPGYWMAIPGTAPSGEWSQKTAYGYLLLGEAMRRLAACGWDVPGEYVGDSRVATFGPHVMHVQKAPRFIRVSEALEMEGLPPLHSLAQERA